MGCDIDFEVLMAYLDGELSPIDRGRVAEHIVGCEACRETVNDLRAVSGALTKWVVPEPQGLPTARELLDRAGAARPAEVIRPVWRGVVVRWAAVAALAVVAVTIAAVVMNRSGEYGGRETVAEKRDAPSAEPPPQAPTEAGRAANTQPAAPGSSASNANSAPAPATPLTTAQEAPVVKEPVDKAAPEPTGEEKSKDVDANTAAGAGAPIMQPAPVQAPKPEAPASAPPPPPVSVPSDSRNEVVENRAQSPSADGVATGGLARGRKTGKESKISIQSDVLTIETHDVDSAVSAVESAAKSAGGNLASRGSGARRDGGRSVTLTVTVPVERYEALVSRIKGVGTVKGEVRSSRNVGESLDELEDQDDAERQRSKMAEQARTATIRITIKEP